MGIPKFFRFMSERYPLISQLVEENKVPEIDRLYLDMNGIIHNCSHPNDGDAHFRMTETEIFLAIFSYIEHIFHKIKPKEVFFLAVDGVAPRAKMNQQRSRRFRTAKEARDLKMKALQRGEELPEEEAFDSNCITPGTPFMARLSEQLKWFIAKKVTEDSAWQGPKIILSGHDVPGEGEHKVMEYIRLAKAQPGYNPNIRHCLYGLDADLIMLGLLSHDPHFALLREEVSFGPRKKKSGGLESQNFFLLHLSLFREYLELDFADLRSTLPFEFSLERIIDDFILFNVFVGNDFLPHLPGLHINEGALPLLYEIYKKILPIAGGYVNEGGTLRIDRLKLIVAELAKWERTQFEEEHADMFMKRYRQQKNNKAMEKARAKNKIVLSEAQKSIYDTIKNFVQAIRMSPQSASRDLFLAPNVSEDDKSFISELCRTLGLGLSFDEYDPVEDSLAIAISSNMGLWEDDEVAAAESEAAIARVLKKYDGATVEKADAAGTTQEAAQDEDEEYEKMVDQKMVDWKRDYYKSKLEFDYEDKEAMQKVAYRYVEGLQWVLHYYYDGVASWGWFYDYHYAPKIGDLFDAMEAQEMTFDYKLGQPFRPFDQLMGVLPPLSSQHIPEAFRELMTDPNSPIIDFYPANFEADLNGKKQDWEAIVKIPFIDEARLLDALNKRDGRLSAEEKQRNTNGSSWECSYDEVNESFYASSLPGVFPDIVHSRAKIAAFNLPTLDGLRLIKGLPNGVELGAKAMAGFPSLKTLPYYSRLGHHGVSVFQGESKGESVVINVENQFEDVATEDVAEAMVGKRIFTSWPFLSEGLVIAVSDSLFRHEMGLVGNQKRIVKNPHSADAQSKWRQKSSRIEHHNSKRFGIITGSVDVLVHVRLLKGLRRLEDGAFVKDYEDDADKEVEQAVQLCVTDVAKEDDRFLERAALPLHKEYPEKTKAFFLGEHAFGSPAAVVGCTGNTLAIEVAFMVNQSRENAALHQLVATRARETYHAAFIVAKKLGLSGLALSKITSSMLLTTPDGGKINVGLNLKFEAKGQKVLGYTRKTASGWEYSERAIALVNEFKEAFPEIPQKIMASPKDDVRDARDFFGEGSASARTAQLKEWIKSKGVRDLDAVPLYAEQLGKDTIAAIEAFTARIAGARTSSQSTIKRVVMKGLPRTALLKPSHAPYRLQIQRFELGDRVIAVGDTGTVPMSNRGVVVGLHSNSIDVVFDAPFLAGTTLSDRCSPHRGGTVGFASVLNLTQPQFICKSGANGVDASANLSALERTIGPIEASTPTGPANGRGVSHARGGRGGGHPGQAGYRPPNAFTAAPKRANNAPPTGPAILTRNGQTNGHGPTAVKADTHFSHVASGSAKPTEEQAKMRAKMAEGVNPLLASLNLNGSGGGSHGHANGSRGGANGRGGRGGGRGRGSAPRGQN